MKLKELTVCFENKCVFTNFSQKFEPNTVTAVLGASGVGKTTLLNCIAELLPYGGAIEGAGRVSYMFQEPRLVKTLTVRENLLYVLGGRKARQGDLIRLNEMLEKVELKECENSFIGELSGGMESRVSLARAFLFESEILLMDEPFRSLDVGLKDRILKVFSRLIKEFPRTVLWVTHDIGEAVSVADRIIVLNGSPAEITADFAVDADTKNSEEKAAELGKRVYYSLTSIVKA